MIRIHLGSLTLARTRIAISPLNESVAALELLHRYGPQAPWPYTEWARRAWEVLRTVPQVAALHVHLHLAEAGRGQRTPDVFEPMPEVSEPELGQELDALRGTPSELAEAQFATHWPGGVPDFLVPYQRDHAGAFAALADAHGEFWRLAIAPHWPSMRTALDEEVLLRARSLATAGPESLLARLGGRTVWEPPVLSLPKSRETQLVAADQRLLLLPLVFAGDRVGCSTDHPEILRVSYQARGAALLAGGIPAPTTEPDRLIPLVGSRRAQVLRALETPSTTTAMATALGLAPSTVSEQLSALVDAGVAYRRRSGRSVLYGLEPAGEVLLALFQLTDGTIRPRRIL
ncbi:winged helix-turn-helix domain-containing protein [Actinokineospora globicatena]|uniref:Transcriptional regulator n=1 Tax=Actinokineospora globicatena TaxID=103729 RepID=A0A9W6QL82_9PSEU|nr:winged helix-turn-helix domain-containing protein [Actinokineospora globicatena]GLW90622.1 transcriptional regulator [Actinokineospora globicatena]